jgi:hypothetical protein
MKARYTGQNIYMIQGIAKNIMSQVRLFYTPYYEGEVMALYAIALGIDPKKYFTETKAEHSTENIYYPIKRQKKLGFFQGNSHLPLIPSRPNCWPIIREKKWIRISADTHGN